MDKSIKEFLLKVLNVIEREAEGENVHICEEFSSEEVKDILKKEFGWKEPSYGKLSKNQIVEAADKFTYSDEYENLCKNGLTKENKEKALKFLFNYWKITEVTKDAEKEFFKWIKDEIE